ncbi:hypothetical protein [Sporichthya sp.]|uniref:hypothetical protein n=1 Tax=Sporichthya sp. TaxID=65475 RepID=UPI001840087F|nr:hypothetical protein [Sporichthya sp.]MBA3741719.1 hypothetical protein [Sporichthya sp.]
MKYAVRVLSGAVLGVGLAVLVGWYFHLDTLTSLVPGYASMKPNTALGLAVLAGGDIWYEANRPSGACFAVRLPVAREPVSLPRARREGATR